MTGYVLKSKVMCLENLTTRKPMIAEEDIVCYKTLFLCVHSNKLRTVWRRAIVEIGKTYKSKLIREKGLYSTNVINKGLHSYINLCAHNPEIIRVECVIPKGSKYYRGVFGISESYASDTLKYVKIIG